METDHQPTPAGIHPNILEKNSRLFAAAAFCIIFLYRLISFIVRASAGYMDPFDWWYLPYILSFVALGGLSASLFLKNRKALFLFAVMDLLVHLIYFGSDLVLFLTGFLAFDIFDIGIILSSLLDLIPYLALTAVCAMLCRGDRFTDQYWYVPALIALAASVIAVLQTIVSYYISSWTWLVLNFIFIDGMLAAGICLIGLWARQEISVLPDLPKKAAPVFVRPDMPDIPQPSPSSDLERSAAADFNQKANALQEEDAAQLRRLKMLYDEGVLSEEEFTQKKKQILGI